MPQHSSDCLSVIRSTTISNTIIGTLSSLCVTRIVNIIHDWYEQHILTCHWDRDRKQSDDMLCPHMKSLREDVLSHTEPNRSEEIMWELLQSNNENCTLQIHLLAVPLLMTTDIKKIDFVNCCPKIKSDVEHTCYNKDAVEFTVNMLSENVYPKLVELRLFELPSDFGKVFKNLPSLKILELHHVCHGEVLYVIGKYCTKLVELCLYGCHFSRRIEIELQFLCYSDFPSNTYFSNKICNSLEILSFDSRIRNTPKKVPSHVNLIIQKNMQNIVEGNYYFHATACFAKENNIPISKKITQISLVEMNYELLNVVSDHCPNVTELCLLNPSRIVLERLDKFKKLTTLKLKLLASYSESKSLISDIYAGLDLHGAAITVLHIEHGNGGKIDLSKLSWCCPNVEELKFENVRLVKLKNGDFNKLSIVVFKSVVSDIEGLFAWTTRLPSVKNVTFDSHF